MIATDVRRGDPSPAGEREVAPPVAPSPPPARPVRHIRNWPVPRKLLAILVLPVVAASVIGGIRVAGLLEAARELSVDAALSEAQRASAHLLREVSREQLVTTASVSGVAGATGLPGLDEQREATDTAAAELTTRVAELPEPGDAVSTRARSVVSSLDRLDAVRAEVDEVTAGGGRLSGAEAAELVRAYTDVSGAALRLGDALAAAVVDDGLQRLARSGQSLAAAGRQEAVQNALVLVIAATGPGSIEPAELRSAEAARLVALTAFEDTATTSQQVAFDEIALGESPTARTQLYQDLLGAVSAVARTSSTEPSGSVPLDPVQWLAAAVPSVAANDALRSDLNDEQVQLAGTLRDDRRDRAVVDAGVLVLLLLLGVAFTLYMARSVVRPLRVLRDEARQIASDRLPQAIRRIRESPTDQPPSSSVTPVDVDTTEETGQVARAFDEVHTVAVQLASEQEQLRRSVNEVFVNLSRRSQGLVERQLRLIDELENQEVTPEQLGELFQLDHLAARMRRNNDNLLVLAGGEGSRGAGAPLSLVDIARAAISETEEYGRIQLNEGPRPVLSAAASRDLVHLLAELLDNATSFSPPHQPVVVETTGSTEHGVVVEVVDRGIGMSAPTMLAFNQKLADPPVVDPSVPVQMGLFVVSRLAQRHGFQVELSRNDDGVGLRVTTWVPPSALASEAPGSLPRRHAARGAAGSAEAAGPAARTGPDGAPGEPTRPARSGAAPTSGSGGVFVRHVDTDEFPLLVPGPASPPTPASPTHAETTPAETTPAETTAAAPTAGSTPRTGPDETPLFDELSAWFGRRSEEEPGPSGTEAPGTFASPADDGWHAVAETARDRQNVQPTAAGLPQRVPRANLVPGGVATPPATDVERRGGRVDRTPDGIRSRLSGFQRGLARGRDRPLERWGAAAGPSGQAQENSAATPAERTREGGERG